MVLARIDVKGHAANILPSILARLRVVLLITHLQDIRQHLRVLLPWHHLGKLKREALCRFEVAITFKPNLPNLLLNVLVLGAQDFDRLLKLDHAAQAPPLGHFEILVSFLRTLFNRLLFNRFLFYGLILWLRCHVQKILVRTHLLLQLH